MASAKNKQRECGIALFVLCVIVCIANASEQYEIPEPKFKLLKPKGFQVSIPDEHGIQLFAFHGNLNKKMEKMGNGQFADDIIEKSNGKWIYQNPKLKIRAGDVIYFWVFVIKDGVGYTREEGMYEVSEKDVKQTAKKIHKLRKRFARRYNSLSDSYGSEYNPDRFAFHHTYGVPHNHHRFHDVDMFSPRGRYTFGGPYAPHHHGPFGYRGHHTQEYHNQDHHRGFGDHPHFSWGHSHGPDCDWSESSDDENNTNESDTTKELETPKVKPTTNDETTLTTSTEEMTTEPESEMVTTTLLPQIDLRFGDKTK